MEKTMSKSSITSCSSKGWIHWGYINIGLDALVSSNNTNSVSAAFFEMIFLSSGLIELRGTYWLESSFKNFFIDAAKLHQRVTG